MFQHKGDISSMLMHPRSGHAASTLKTSLSAPISAGNTPCTRTLAHFSHQIYSRAQLLAYNKSKRCNSTTWVGERDHLPFQCTSCNFAFMATNTPSTTLAFSPPKRNTNSLDLATGAYKATSSSAPPHNPSRRGKITFMNLLGAR